MDAISRLKRGDISGLESLVLKHQAKALKTAYLITADRAIAEDLVQSAFIRVYERARQFDAKRNFEPWFLRIIVNDAVKAVTRNKRHISIDGGWNDAEANLLKLLPDKGLDPSELLEVAEQREVVWEALQCLSPGQRAVVVQRFYLGLTEAESAEQYGKSIGTVKQLMHRAKKRLHMLLKDTISMGPNE